MSRKIALISDIHGNVEALNAVLKDLDKQNANDVIVLGDLAYRGPEPKKSIALVRSLGCPVVGGNADDWVVRGIHEGEVPPPAFLRMQEEQSWTRAHLDEKDIDYLRMLPDTHTIFLQEDEALFVCHATPEDRFRVLLPDTPDDILWDTFFHLDIPGVKNIKVAAYGHSHLPFIRFIRGSIVVNPGSVGLPFDHIAMPSYALLHMEDGHTSVSIRRVSYDISHAANVLKRQGYPHQELMVKALLTGTKP